MDEDKKFCLEITLGHQSYCIVCLFFQVDINFINIAFKKLGLCERNRDEQLVQSADNNPCTNYVWWQNTGIEALSVASIERFSERG
jgi:hypothetical protein